MFKKKFQYKKNDIDTFFFFFIKFYSTTYVSVYRAHCNKCDRTNFSRERVWSILGRNIPPRYHEACKSGIGKAQRERERERRKKETRKWFRGVRRG